MDRIKLINEIFRKTKFKNYLEIGCSTGGSFLPVKAKNKTAIDPYFKVPLRRKIKWGILVPENYNNKYFEEESDTFFKNRTEYLDNLGKLDVVLVDGLHTFRASLSDVLNSLQYLNENGIIIMHDCFPPNAAAALPTVNYPKPEEVEGVEGWTMEWCGDVWKTIVYLREKHNASLDICVIDTDYGLGIVRPRGNIDNEELVIDEKLFSRINNLTYDEMKKDPLSVLNLKDQQYTALLVSDIAERTHKQYDKIDAKTI
jgi:hypothetical protein